MTTTFILICRYCGHQWEYQFYGYPDPEYVKCSVCKDTQIVIKKKDKIDYYKEKENK